jgi:hypothetical protein
MISFVEQPIESRSSTPAASIAALQAERARQDAALDLAWSCLSARGVTPVTVPVTALEAIDRATLVSVSHLNPCAVRG